MSEILEDAQSSIVDTAYLDRIEAVDDAVFTAIGIAGIESGRIRFKRIFGDVRAQRVFNKVLAKTLVDLMADIPSDVQYYRVEEQDD